MEGEHGGVERRQDGQALGCDGDADDAAVPIVTAAGDEPGLFQAVEEAGEIGLAGDHASGDFPAGQGIGAGAAEDPKDVVLSGAEAGGFQQARHILHQAAGGALELDEGFLFRLYGHWATASRMDELALPAKAPPGAEAPVPRPVRMRKITVGDSSGIISRSFRNMSITRREFAAALAAPAMLNTRVDAALVKRHDDRVDEMLKRQITDPAHPGAGGYADEYGLFHAGTGAGLLEGFVSAWACPQSRHYREAALIERMKLAAAYLAMRQHEDGTIDLLTTNFHSTPDLGFVIHGAAAAAWIAREAGSKEVWAAVEPFLRKAGDALSHGGVHTPNHRWVVCEALSQINELLPDPKLVRRAEQWLAEGIDIDADGQYNERSTSVYNPVTDKALLVTALKLNKPELLDAVRRNLESMLYLWHPDGEVVTEISNRQDQYNRAGMDRYWLPLRYLAILDHNGRLAEATRRVEERGASLSAYLRYPELSRPLPAPEPLPDNFHRLMPLVKIARVRRGAMSATIMLNGNSRILAMRQGGCVVEAVRFASAFFGKGQFRPAKWETVEGGYRLTQSLTGPYYQPLNPPRKVDAPEYNAVRSLRPQSGIQRMEYVVTLREQGRGFRMDIEAQGTAGVPLSVEITLRENVVLEGVAPARGKDAFLLKAGYATARVGAGAIRFGPGFGEHAYTDVRGAEPRLAGQSVYLCGFTPLKKTIEFAVPA